MKNKLNTLITAVFASLTLGVIAGADFTNKQTEVTPVAAGTTYYWKPITSVSNLTNDGKVIIGCVSNKTFYYFNDMAIPKDANYWDGYSSTLVWNSSQHTENNITYLKTTDNSSYFKVKKYDNYFKLYFAGSTSYYLGVSPDGVWSYADGTKIHAFFRPQSSWSSFSGNTNFTFKGYYTGTDGTGTQYYDENGKTSKVYSVDGDLTLYACWEVDKTSLNTVVGAGKLAFKYGSTPSDDNQFRLVLALDSSIVEIGNSYGASEAGMYLEKNGTQVAMFDFINNKIILEGEEHLDASIYEEEADNLTLKYIIVDLNDLLADATYAYDEYTFCAYMKVDGEYCFADNYKTYSFVSLLNTYIEMMPEETSLTKCKTDLGLI